MKIQLIIKRVIDIILSICGLIILAPLFLLIGILIKIESKGEVFYRQARVGKNEKIFRIFKFRSMITNAENIGKGLYFDGEDDPRITKMGKFIRKTSLDELPQIINIFLGNMSIVGPRPMIMPIYEKLDNNQRKRSRVLPGITGLAQVNGRNNIPWSKRIEYDLEYCNEFSLFLDIKIMLKTFKVVFGREGIRMDQIETEVDDLNAQ